MHFDPRRGMTCLVRMGRGTLLVKTRGRGMQTGRAGFVETVSASLVLASVDVVSSRPILKVPRTNVFLPTTGRHTKGEHTGLPTGKRVREMQLWGGFGDACSKTRTVDHLQADIDNRTDFTEHLRCGANLCSQVEGWISRASARQRRGRAGRVASGYAFSLYTKKRAEVLMSPFQKPEMVRNAT